MVRWLTRNTAASWPESRGFDPHVGRVFLGGITNLFSRPFSRPFSRSLFSAHPDAQITLKPGFATTLQIAKGRAYPAPT